MKRIWKIVLISIGVIALIWLLLEPIALRYLNKKLNDIEGYTGQVQDVDIYLLSGGIQIDSLVLDVEKDGFTKPFLSMPSSFASLHWSALLDGRIVSEIVMINPAVTYEIEPNTQDNVDENLDWLEIVKDIGVVTLNRCEIHGGKAEYLDRSTEKPVKLFIDSLEVLAKNLASVRDLSKELPSYAKISGYSIGQGRIDFIANVNLIKSVPDIDASLEFTSVDLTAFNDAFYEYARIDVEEGSLEFFSEIALKDSSLSGYLKPVLKNMKVIDWDEKEENRIKSIWEGLAGLLIKPFENNKENQIATKIPVKGRITDVKQGVWSAIYTLVINAVIEPLKTELDQTITLDDAKKEKGLFEKDN